MYTSSRPFIHLSSQIVAHLLQRDVLVEVDGGEAGAQAVHHELVRRLESGLGVTKLGPVEINLADFAGQQREPGELQAIESAVAVPGGLCLASASPHAASP